MPAEIDPMTKTRSPMFASCLKVLFFEVFSSSKRKNAGAKIKTIKTPISTIVSVSVWGKSAVEYQTGRPSPRPRNINMSFSP